MPPAAALGEEGQQRKVPIQRPLLNNHGFVIVMTMFGIVVTSVLLFVGSAIQDGESKVSNNNNVFYELPLLAQRLNMSRQSFLVSVKKFICRPIFIGVSIAVIFLIILIATLYFTYPLLKVRFAENEVLPVVRPPKQIDPAAEASSEPASNRFKFSSLISSAITIVVFAIALLILYRFSSSLNNRVIFGIILAIVILMFLFAKFEDYLSPFILYLPKKLIVTVAQSTIHNVDA